MTDAGSELAQEMSRPGVDGATDDKEVACLVKELRELTREATIDLSLRVGRLLIERCCEGEIDKWRNRGKRLPMLRALARRRDLPMSASALYRSIAIYELSDRVGGLSRWKHLGVSHLRAVLPLEQELQVQVLSLAESERWTVARVELETGRRRSSRATGGRPRLPRCIKALRSLERQAKAPAPFLRDDDELACLDAATLRRLDETVKSLLSSLSDLQNAVEHFRRRGQATDVAAVTPLGDRS